MIMYSINLIHTHTPKQTHTHKKTANHTNKTQENIYKYIYLKSIDTI